MRDKGRSRFLNRVGCRLANRGNLPMAPTIPNDATVVGVVGNAVQASSGYGAHRIDDDEIGNEFQGCSQEERPA